MISKISASREFSEKTMVSEILIISTRPLQNHPWILNENGPIYVSKVERFELYEQKKTHRYNTFWIQRSDCA